MEIPTSNENKTEILNSDAEKDVTSHDEEKEKKEVEEIIRIAESDLNLLKSKLTSSQQTIADKTIVDRAFGHLERASNLLKDVSDKNNKVQLYDFIKEYSHVILDETFIQETVLIENDFPKSKKHQFDEILLFLRKPKSLIYNLLEKAPSYIIVMSEKEKNIKGKLTKEEERERAIQLVLGTDITEVLYWRIGALFYMYSSVLITKHRIEELDKSYLEIAVKELNHMRKLRLKSKRASQKIDDTGDDVEALLSHGIYSDTHLLALIYGGESAYYRYIHFSNDENSEYYKKKSIELLKKFEYLVENFLKSAGWNADKATQMIETLQKMN